MESTIHKILITTVTPMLGSQPGSDSLFTDVAKAGVLEKNPELADNIEEEEETIDEQITHGSTVFAKVDGRPVFFNYQMKGMLKEAAKVLRDLGGIKAFRSKVDNCVMVNPRIIPIDGELSGEFLERPLRVETRQGPRVCLSRSEMINPGAKILFEVECLKTPKFQLSKDGLVALMEYAQKKGLAQWRNSGFYGQFEWQFVE